MTCLAITCNDIGAYFGGKAFGRTPLGAISPAAGATSPSKTVEGALSGIAATAAVATLGARLLRWPRPLLSGIAYGSLMGVVALLGDLTASMFKRDAGVKDFGDMFPGHGGMLDRFDSYIMTGVASYAFGRALPFLGPLSEGRRAARARARARDFVIPGCSRGRGFLYSYAGGSSSGTRTPSHPSSVSLIHAAAASRLNATRSRSQYSMCCRSSASQ